MLCACVWRGSIPALDVSSLPEMMKGERMKGSFRSTKRIMLLGVWVSILLGPSHAVDAQQRKRSKPAGKPQISAPDSRFDSGQSALKIPFDLLNNLVLLPVRVNGSQPLWFILDVGATSSVINTRLVKELGLRTKGKVKGSSGLGAIEVDLVPGISFALPGVKVFNLTVGSISLDPFAPVLGRAIGGIIGYDLISQFTVEIDYEDKTINLYTPAGYQYAGAGDRLPIKFLDKQPFIDALITVEGRAPVKGKFAVSTASSGALLLNRPFVEAHQLLKTVTKTSLGNTGGVGGLTRTLVGRVKNIRVGRFGIDNPIVSFSQATEGEQAGAAYDGVLGGEVFRRFKLILDYSRRQIILEPNAHLPEAVEEDMSGLEFIAEGEDFGTYIINEIIPNSPAAEAGFQEEDELTEIDGRRVAELGPEQIRRMFMREGKEYLLSIRRGEQKLQVKIKLRRLR